MDKYFVRFCYTDVTDSNKDTIMKSLIITLDHCSEDIDTIENLEEYLLIDYFQAHKSMYKEYNLDIIIFNKL